MIDDRKSFDFHGHERCLKDQCEFSSRHLVTLNASTRLSDYVLEMVTYGLIL